MVLGTVPQVSLNMLWRFFSYGTDTIKKVSLVRLCKMTLHGMSEKHWLYWAANGIMILGGGSTSFNKTNEVFEENQHSKFH